MQIIRLVAAFLPLAIMLINILSSPVYALSQAQKDSLRSGALYFNTEIDGTVQCGTTTGGAQSGPVYFIGDSIGTQIQSGLSSNFSSDGFKANAVSGRTLPQGLSAIDSDAGFVKTASIAIVELGTNSAGLTAGNVTQMVDKLKTLNPSITIYWIDTAVVVRQDYARTLSNVNKTIYAQNSSYQVISWNKKVFGENADPTNINPDAPDNGYIRRADEFVHLTDKGIDAMVGLISSSVGKGGSSTSGSCACTGSANLVGNTNAEKAFRYFMDVEGLSAIQSAAIVGNFMRESGVNPKNVQGDNTPDQDNITVDGQTGYGIAQWTYIDRQRALDAFAKSKGVITGLLDLQLSFVSVEGKSALQTMKTIASIEVATEYWMNTYEKPGVPALSERIDFAKNALASFGSGSPGTPGGSTGCSDTESGIVNTEGYAYPVAPLNKSMPRPGYGHADPYAFDFMRPGGTTVFAVVSGTIGYVNPAYNINGGTGIPGCESINLYGSDGWKYWYGHVQKSLVKEGDKVEAGQKIAEVAAESFGAECWGGGTHVHLDRGFPKGENGGYRCCRADTTFIPFIQKLYDELPN